MFNKQQILDAYNYRYATKKYDPSKDVSEEDMNFILETGRLSPSSFGLEPWRFLVIPKSNAKIRDLINEHSWGIKDKKDATYYVIYLSRRAEDLQPNSEFITHILKDIKGMPEDILNVYRGFYTNQAGELSHLLGEENVRALEDWASKQTLHCFR
ncbi:nitroreductase family protein [Psittacicella melopsittaci]|uniref:nitroreductase family protein n=1 Tax=Psittacicella melopsittaci TaxID=2028576 RepID=UPI0031F42A54